MGFSSGRAAIASRGLADNDGGADGPFSGIVGRLNEVVGEEGEEAVTLLAEEVEQAQGSRVIRCRGMVE